jgi:hypothetical protein
MTQKTPEISTRLIATAKMMHIRKQIKQCTMTIEYNNMRPANTLVVV